MGGRGASSAELKFQRERLPQECILTQYTNMTPKRPEIQETQMCEKKRGERQTRGGLEHKGTKSWQDSDGEEHSA